MKCFTGTFHWAKTSYFYYEELTWFKPIFLAPENPLLTGWSLIFIRSLVWNEFQMGRGQKHAEGVVGFFFFHSWCHKLWCGPGQERPFFNCEKRACNSKKCQKCCHFFGEKSPKISDRHINNRLYNYEKVQNLISFSIIT